MVSIFVLTTCLSPTQLCGGEQTKRKSFIFYFWFTPNCAGVDRQSENHLIFYFWSTPNFAGVGRRSENYSIFYFWSTSNCAEGNRRSKNQIIFYFLCQYFFTTESIIKTNVQIFIIIKTSIKITISQFSQLREQ